MSLTAAGGVNYLQAVNGSPWVQTGRAFTVMCWVNIAATPATWSPVLATYESVGQDSWELGTHDFTTGASSHRWYFGYHASAAYQGYGNATQKGVTTSSILGNNTWYHLCIRYGVNGAAVYDHWLNGVLDGTSTTTVALPAGSRKLGIKFSGDHSPNLSFNGQIAFIRVFEGCLTPDKIKLCMQASNVPASLRSVLLVDIPCTMLPGANQWALDLGPRQIGALAKTGTATFASDPLTTAVDTPDIWTVLRRLTSITQVGKVDRFLYNQRATTGLARKALWTDNVAASKVDRTFWNERTTASGRDAWLWALRGTVGPRDSLLWNDRGTAGSRDLLSWADRQAAAGVKTALWNERQTASARRSILWGLIGHAGLAKTFLWNARAIVGLREQALWSNRLAVGQHDAILWAARQVASSVKRALWTSTVFAGRLGSQVWNDRTAVTTMDRWAWNERVVVSLLQRDVWNDQLAIRLLDRLLWSSCLAVGLLGRELWNDKATATVVKRLGWHDLAAVGKKDAALWADAITVSCQDRTCWVERTVASLGRQMPADVRAAVGRIDQAFWQDRVLAGRGSRLSWNDLLTISGGNRDLLWTIRRIVSSVDFFPAQIRSLVGPRKDLAWSDSLVVTAGSTDLLLWQTHTLVGLARQLLCDLRATAGLLKSSIWAGRALVDQRLRLPWNDLAVASGDHLLPWDEQWPISRLSRQFWAVRRSAGVSNSERWSLYQPAAGQDQLLWTLLAGPMSVIHIVDTASRNSGAEIHAGNCGVAFRYAATGRNGEPVDVSCCSLRQIRFQTPGNTFSKTATPVTDGRDGQVQYIAAPGDLAAHGLWRWQPYFEWPSGRTLHGKIMKFTVIKNLG